MAQRSLLSGLKKALGPCVTGRGLGEAERQWHSPAASEVLQSDLERRGADEKLRRGIIPEGRPRASKSFLGLPRAAYKDLIRTLESVFLHSLGRGQYWEAGPPPLPHPGG